MSALPLENASQESRSPSVGEGLKKVLDIPKRGNYSRKETIFRPVMSSSPLTPTPNIFLVTNPKQIPSYAFPNQTHLAQLHQNWKVWLNSFHVLCLWLSWIISHWLVSWLYFGSWWELVEIHQKSRNISLNHSNKLKIRPPLIYWFAILENAKRLFWLPSSIFQTLKLVQGNDGQKVAPA